MIKYINKDAVIYAIKRAIWTMAEVILSMIGIGMTISEIDWAHILSVAAVAGIISILKSIIVGMPEIGTDGTLVIEDGDEKQQWTLNVETDPLEIQNKSSIRLKVNKQ